MTEPADVRGSGHRALAERILAQHRPSEVATSRYCVHCDVVFPCPAARSALRVRAAAPQR